MNYYAPPVARLIQEFEKLPGIGHKSAQRLAFHILSQPPERAEQMAAALVDAAHNIICCEVCFNLSDVSPCALCTASGRERDLICVVENPRDVVALEKTREFKGLYHVLHGAISPIDGIGPDEIRLKELISRVGAATIREVVVATNPNVTGEATAMYIARLLKPLGVKVTRIAHGLPVGADLEYADELTLARALEGRREI